MSAAEDGVEVYVDVVLMVNFIMDFFILWATAKLVNRRYRIIRLILGAAFGALYSLAVFFPEQTILTSFVVKVLCSVIMVLLAFAPLTKQAFIRTMGYLYVVSFAMGGAVIACIYLSDPAPGSMQVLNGAVMLTDTFNYFWLTIALGLAILLGCAGMAYLRKNWIQHSLVSEIVVALRGRRIGLKALLDTGNQLVEPLSQLPVVIVEARSIKNELPENLWNAVISGDDIKLQEITAQLDTEWAARLRMIPFNSVGREHGLMLGFRPDYIEIRNRQGTTRIDSAVIGLVNRVLSKEGKYEALLHPQLAQEGIH